MLHFLHTFPLFAPIGRITIKSGNFVVIIRACEEMGGIVIALSTHSSVDFLLVEMSFFIIS